MKASAEQEDRKFPPPRSGRNIQAETLGDWGPAEPPHPASRAALAQRLQQETAARELAEALHAKKAQQLDLLVGELLRLKGLIVGLHLEQGADDPGFATARMELEREAQRIHGCAGGACSAWAGFGETEGTPT